MSGNFLKRETSKWTFATWTKKWLMTGCSILTCSFSFRNHQIISNQTTLSLIVWVGDFYMLELVQLTLNTPACSRLQSLWRGTVWENLEGHDHHGGKHVFTYPVPTSLRQIPKKTDSKREGQSYSLFWLYQIFRDAFLERRINVPFAGKFAERSQLIRFLRKEARVGWCMKRGVRRKGVILQGWMKPY